MIDTLKLEIFIYAAQTLNFSDVAKQLHLTQPTVSYHIKALEKQLGVALFDRMGSRIQLTEAGRVLLPWARKLLHQSSEIEDMISALKNDVIGQLRIACSTTAGKYVLPQLAARFCQLYSKINVIILRCTSENVIPQLLQNEANLGVVSFEVKDENLEYQKFFEDSVSLIVSRDHPWAVKRFIEPEDLIGEPIIIREPNSGTKRVMLSELAKFDISVDDLNIFMELGNAEAAVRMVADGYAVSFVSTLALACPLERGRLSKLKCPVLTCSARFLWSGIGLRNQIGCKRFFGASFTTLQM
jgi:DNA-binding transcriptional LysR family regulator